MHHTYNTQGTCSTKIDFDLNDGIVTGVAFTGGCNGNLKAVAKLVEGMAASEIEAKLGGVLCGARGTSCADQLARAVRAAAQ
ncbi:MAG: TIGR03905 family TSCPD domain-containing protein [Lachnospiraceae bacterium]|jgi:uncharacterized protein (TIGR03905 family)|nr:TIGR03905 family TSCPD domain-containing protein [Lachnospiraceae bacterium]